MPISDHIVKLIIIFANNHCLTLPICAKQVFKRRLLNNSSQAQNQYPSKEHLTPRMSSHKEDSEVSPFIMSLQSKLRIMSVLVCRMLRICYSILNCPSKFVCWSVFWQAHTSLSVNQSYHKITFVNLHFSVSQRCFQGKMSDAFSFWDMLKY